MPKAQYSSKSKRKNTRKKLTIRRRSRKRLSIKGKSRRSKKGCKRVVPLGLRIKGKNRTLKHLDIKRSSTGWLLKKSKLGKYNWASISKGYLYLAYPKGRAYWILTNFCEKDLPLITSNDKTLTISVSSFKMRFKRTADYNWAKKCLIPFSNKATASERKQRLK